VFGEITEEEGKKRGSSQTKGGKGGRAVKTEHKKTGSTRGSWQVKFERAERTWRGVSTVRRGQGHWAIVT